MTGYPWAVGDALLAADLNAAIANASSVSDLSVNVKLFGAEGPQVSSG